MRIVFEYRPQPQHVSSDFRALLPPGLALQRIDAAIAGRLQEDLVAAGNPPWFDKIWGGIDAFLAGGFGYAILNDGAVVSNCRSWSVIDGVAAIQVSTRGAFRERGLGCIVCSAFVEDCRSRGLQPEYSCVEENSASYSLASKLGFVAVGKVDEEESS